MMFENRIDAASQLIPQLGKYADKNAVVLAVPRGAVPMGYHIAKDLHLPLDILLTKKIGHPENNELAVGSVSLEGCIIDPRFKVSDAYIKGETERIRQFLKERHLKFSGNRSPIELEGKTVIIVDDGLATGNTMLSSVELVRNHHPKKIVVAVPVASTVALKKLKGIADEVICLCVENEFMAIGQFYYDFSEVTDDQVIYFLGKWKEESAQFNAANKHDTE
jgi:predicted phosphoribosyltransferase